MAQDLITTPSPKPLNELAGPERAALLLLAVGDEYGKAIWESLHDEEISEISRAMAVLGEVDLETVESLLVDFSNVLAAKGAVMGNFDNTERLLMKFLPEGRVNNIMEEIRGPAGRNMWEKLSNVQDTVLASYLKNEYPQTVAVVLSKIVPGHAASVLSNLPDDFALEVVNRMLNMEAVQRDILDKVEDTLRTEFMSSLAQTRRRDAHEQMAEIFNNFDRQTEGRFLDALEEDNRDAADKIKALMFTFEDLAKLDNASIQTLLRHVERDQLALALKGSTERMREFFMGNMTERAAKMLRDDMEVMGPVRLKDVDQAQMGMVNKAKDLGDSGEIMISKNKGDDELVY